MDAPQSKVYPDSLRNNRVIRLPFLEDNYREVVADFTLFRARLDKMIIQHPELFPSDIGQSYRMKDSYTSTKLNLTFRRIEVGTISYSIRPSFVLPYLRSLTDEASNALFLRKFNVPFWAIAHIYGKTAMYWYRLHIALRGIHC